MASSFPQSGEELPQELFPPPESREGFWREGEQQAAFGSTQVGIAPVGPLLWQRRSAWSPFLPFLPLSFPPAWSFRPENKEGFGFDWMMVKTYCLQRKVSMKLKPQRMQEQSQCETKSRGRPQLTEYSSCVSSCSGYTEFTGNKQCDTLLL